MELPPILCLGFILLILLVLLLPFALVYLRYRKEVVLPQGFDSFRQFDQNVRNVTPTFGVRDLSLNVGRDDSPPDPAPIQPPTLDEAVIQPRAASSQSPVSILPGQVYLRIKPSGGFSEKVLTQLNPNTAYTLVEDNGNSNFHDEIAVPLPLRGNRRLARVEQTKGGWWISPGLTRKVKVNGKWHGSPTQIQAFPALIEFENQQLVIEIFQA